MKLIGNDMMANNSTNNAAAVAAATITTAAAITNPTAAEDITDCMFTVGSIVSCLTCYDQRVDGEVIAFDYTKRLLILKSNSTDGNVNHNDIHCLNLESVKDVTVKNEVKREDVVNTQLPQINTSKVDDRCRRAIDERRRLTDAFKAGASADGIKLWLQLTKTMSRDVVISWDGDNIIVDHSVRIVSPYKVDNCTQLKSRGNGPQTSLNFTKRLVEKFWNDQKLNATVAAKQQPTTTTTSSGGQTVNATAASGPTSPPSQSSTVNKSATNSAVQPTDKPPFNNKG
ncbi:protein LSM12-like [Oppia nitens]|uniref:protein LSM12-like n=1 Tax=Oppia nitens TaxID=1686743 RepID=UPI0023DA56EB|nr:protein LSM12-like [Oppia nitens]